MPDTSSVVTDPFAKFQEWMTEAWSHEPEDANAMTLATATPDGIPSARIVLLKGADARGFVFYTNMTAARARNSRPTRARRCCSTGSRRAARCASRVASNPSPTPRPMPITPPARGSRGWAPGRPTSRARCRSGRSWNGGSRNSRRSIPATTSLARRNWSGYRVIPERFEFWQNMPFRLHDRTVFTRAAAGGWTIGKLYP